ncbi:hypothetical protein [Microbacterium sp.]|uniref:hypothetical protein n=1 Tax=Microbacterium sp. TaxID=51671 RepID=UPI003A8A5662
MGTALALIILALIIVGIVIAVAATNPRTGDSAGVATPAVAPAVSPSARRVGAGSAATPLPVGADVVGEDYTVSVNGFERDATATVLAASPLNPPPPTGFEYAVVNLTVTYTGDGSGHSSFTACQYITDDGAVITPVDTVTVAPEPALGLRALTPHASVDGNIVVAIPDGDRGMLRVRPGTDADHVYVEPD